MKIINILLIFLLSIVPVLGAEIVEIEKEITTDDLFVEVPERDAVSFSYLGDNHRVHIRGITNKGVDVTIFINRNTELAVVDRRPSYLTLKPNDVVRVDVNKDRVNDLIIGLSSINLDEKSVTLLIRETRTDEERNSKVIEQVNFEDKKDLNNKVTGASIFDFSNIKIINLVTVLLFMVIVFLGYFLIRKKK